MAAAFAVALPYAAAQAAPRLDGADTRECRDTLAVARAAFYSKTFDLNDAVTLPKGSAVSVVAQTAGGDLSGGDGVDADPAVFKTLPGNYGGDGGKLFWQIAPVNGVRWVIGDAPFSWRGDLYHLYAVDPNAPEGVLTAPPSGEADILPQNWVPPMVLRNAAHKTVWVVDTDGANSVLGNWQVYSADKGAVTTPCRIAFTRKAEATIDLLPAPVRKLAQLLDGTLGDGRDEGTLHPTGHIRFAVWTAWGNVAVRPWALTMTPYNTRRDADLGLRNWSRRDGNFRKLYRRIRTQWPLAQTALADYYVAAFAKTPEQAKALAAHNLDIVYRSHFVFSQEAIHPTPAK